MQLLEGSGLNKLSAVSKIPRLGENGAAEGLNCDPSRP